MPVENVFRVKLLTRHREKGKHAYSPTGKVFYQCCACNRLASAEERGCKDQRRP